MADGEMRRARARPSSPSSATTLSKGKDVAIFDKRLVADDPLTLQELGDEFGISRERVRQLEAAPHRHAPRLSEGASSGDAVGSLSSTRGGHALRRRDADRQPRRHHAARDRDAAHGRPRRRRGHAAHARAALAPRHRGQAARLARRARRPSATSRASSRWLAAGERVALVHRRRHAGGERSGRRARRAAAAAGVRVVPIPGAVRGDRGARARASSPAVPLRRLPAARGHRARDALAAVRATPEAVVLFESPQRLAATLAELAELCPTARRGRARAHQDARGVVRGHARRAGREHEREWLGEVNARRLGPDSDAASG